MDHPEFFVKTNSSAAFFGHVLLFVLRLHVFFAKIALLIVEIHAVLRQHLCEKLRLYLLHKLINRIAIKKRAFLPSVSMQIAIEKKPVLFKKLYSGI